MIIFYFSPLFGMQLGHQRCPIAMGMGNSSTCIFSPYTNNNPALLSQIDLPSVQVMAENKALLPALGDYYVALAYPFKEIQASITGLFHGFEAYHEYSIDVCLARFFKPYIAVGLQGTYCGLFTAAHKTYTHSGLLSLGAIVFPIPALRIGFSVYNVSFSAFAIDEQTINIPVIFKLGIAYHIAQKVHMTAEVHKALDQPFAFCIGMDYQAVSFLSLRAGLYAQEELTPSLGIGFHWQHLTIDAGFQYHFGTGLNLSIGMAYLW